MAAAIMGCVIYALCDPDTLEIRYIGKANDLTSRLRCHKWETKNNKIHTHKVNWLRSLKQSPVVLVLENVTTETWADAEIRWIKYYREKTANLTNFADGGQTSPVEGKGHSEETKIKLRIIKRGCKPPSRKGKIPWNKGIKYKPKNNKTIFLKGRITWNKGIKKTHCPSGHEYSEVNSKLLFRKDRNRHYQVCKICARQQFRSYLVRKEKKNGSVSMAIH